MTGEGAGGPASGGALGVATDGFRLQRTELPESDDLHLPIPEEGREPLNVAVPHDGNDVLVRLVQTT